MARKKDEIKSHIPLMAHQVVTGLHALQSPPQLDFSDAGTGKTIAHAAAYNTLLERGTGDEKLFVVAPKSLLETAWEDDLRKVNPALSISIAWAHNREEALARDANVYIINTDGVKDLAKLLDNKKARSRLITPGSVFLVDECFPAGTLVDTPLGSVPIERIKTGDLVLTTDGPLPVTETMVKTTNELVEVTFDDGTKVRCTENHPFATQTGWVEARSVGGMRVVRLRVHSNEHKAATLLQSKLQHEALTCNAAGENANGQNKNERGVGRTPGVEQRGTLARRVQTAFERSSESRETETISTGRERTYSPMRSDDGSNAKQCMGVSVCSTNENETRHWLPDELQTGLRASGKENRVGSRWELAHSAQNLGCEERFLVGYARVDSVTRIQCSSDTSVYNLHINGPENYSVAGLLVHNCTSFKHHTSMRSKAAAKVAKLFERRHMLTGTPNSRSITDVWHQVYLADGGRHLGNSFFQFRNQVCEPQQVGMNANAIQWTDKEGAEEAVMAILQDIVIRHRREDCLDLPENQTYAVHYKLTPKQRKAYDQMKELAIAEMSGGKTVTAVNAAIVANKLLQIASGAVYDGERLVHAVEDARYELVCDLVEARAHSLVAFQWTHQRDALVRHFEKNGWSWALIDGTVSSAERKEAVKAFQAGELKVMLCHPMSAGHGLTLTRGTATIWASPTFNAELAEQFRARVFRAGQKLKTENIYVLAEDTYDERAFEICAGRIDLMRSFLSLAEK